MLSLYELDNYLKENNCDFAIIEHKSPIIQTLDAAKYFDIKKSAPTFILQTERGLIALIASFQQERLDFKSIKQKSGFKKIEMADKAEVLKAIGYHVGAIPLIGHNLPCIFDNRLLVHDYVYGGSGDEYHTLKIAPTDIIRLNNIVAFID